MSADDLRRRYIDILFDGLHSGRFPSPPILDRIETAVADRSGAEEYVQLLLDKVGEERYPSPTMLDRVTLLIDTLERSERAG